MEMSYTTIELSRAERIGWITLNRPDALNALSLDMLVELGRALDAIEADGETRVVVITGRSRAFCAGADLKAVARTVGEEGGVRFPEAVQTLFGRIRAFPRPVIAAINGIAMAGGLELAMAADIVLAAEGARIGDAHANYGVIPGAGGCALLPRIVGPILAKYLLFTGEAVSARELQQAGLVAKVFVDAEFESGVRAVATRIAEKSPLALGIMKRLVAEGLEEPSIDAALRLEVDANRDYAGSYDLQEGLTAFAERRKPAFLGR